MTHREFSYRPSTEAPPSFTIVALDADGNPARKEEFTCLPEAPAGTLLDLVSAVGREMGFRSASVVSFIVGVLPAADSLRFQELIYDKDLMVPLEVLVDVVEWLAERYNGRPTPPSSGSPDGPS